LFLDELGEFSPTVLDALRQPLEAGRVTVSRAVGTATFPARFLLVAAMNPCPCGEAGRPGACRCSSAARARYARRLSGPLLDRFDLRVIVDRPPADALLGLGNEESTEVVASRVYAARERASARGVRCNAHLSAAALDSSTRLTSAGRALLEERVVSNLLSGRGVQRVRCVALTLADLAQDDPVLTADRLAMAMSLRAEPQRILLDQVD
jgi:magnesium chelatase family protein